MTATLSERLADPRVRKGMAAAMDDLRRRVATGDQHLGWKVQVNGPSFQKRLGLSGPLLGPLTTASVWEDGGVQPFPRGRCFVEVELGLRLSRDVPSDASLEQCTMAIEAATAAIELLAVDGPFVDAETVLARNGYHAGVVFGVFSPLPEAFQMKDASLCLQIDGRPTASLDPDLIVGEPPEAVRFAAEVLASFGEALRAGQFLICGSLNPPVETALPAQIDAGLAPIGAAAIRLTPSKI